MPSGPSDPAQQEPMDSSEQQGELTDREPEQNTEAIEQTDEADEGRLELG